MNRVIKVASPAKPVAAPQKNDLPPIRNMSETPGRYELPLTKTTPITSLALAMTLMYGEPKIGKTGTAAEFPDNLFIFTERGASGLSVDAVYVDTWDDFKGFVETLRREPRFKLVTLDTWDRLYDLCSDWVCTKQNIDDPGDAPWSKGWRAIRKEFDNEINRLRNTGRGIIMVSHAADKTFKKRNGLEYNKIVPSASKQALKLALSMADITLYFGYYGDTRLMTLAGSDEVEGGTRLAKQFWAKNGERVHSIPAGKDAAEAYKNLVRAFNNEQPTAMRPEVKTGLTDTPPKRKS